MTYLVAGLALSVCGLGILALTPSGYELATLHVFFVAVLLAGLLAGLCYWFAAGRYAGAAGNGSAGR